MTVYKDTIKIETGASKPTYVDITDEVRHIVEASGVKEGIAVVMSCHTTCAIFTEEYDHDHTPDGDTFLQADLSDCLDKIFPEQHDWKTYRYPGLQHFEAVEAWEDAEAYLPGGDRRMLWNGDAHLRSTIIGGNQTYEVENSTLQLNGLASLYFVDFDRTRERTRRVKVVVLGE